MPFQISPKWLTSYTQNPMNRYVFKSLWWYKTFLTTNILVFNITMSLMMDGILILKQTLLFQAHSSPQIIEFKVDLHPSYPFWHSNSWINRVQKWFWTSSFQARAQATRASTSLYSCSCCSCSAIKSNCMTLCLDFQILKFFLDFFLDLKMF